MADTETTIYGGLGSDDLQLFGQQIAANDPWRIGAKTVGSVQLDNRTWTPNQTIGTALAQGLLTGLLGGIAQNREAKQIQALSAALPGLYSDPYSAMTPEGVDGDAFAALKNTAIARKGQLSQLMDKKIADAQLDIRVAGAKKGAEVRGENDAWEAISGRQSQPAQQGATEAGAAPAKKVGNPNNPLYKEETRLAERDQDFQTSLEKDFQAQPEVKNFSLVQTKAKALQQALKDKGGVSDQELVRYALLMIEPTSVVREGEATALANSQSIPEAWKGGLSAALGGQTKLGDEARAQLSRLASRAYESHKTAYDDVLNLYKRRAAARSVDASNLAAFGDVPNAGELFGQPAQAGAGSQQAALLAEAKRRGLIP